MSNGKLKAQYNRVRTSVALQANSMWTKVIGMERDPQSGSNSVIEASLKAPTHRGKGREARRDAAKALLEEAGYEPTVTSFEGLVALARAQGSVGGSKRGACKICGGMGHLTKQCKNHLSGFFNKSEDARAGPSEKHLTLGLIPEESEISSISSEDTERGQKSKRRRKTCRSDKKSHKRHKEKKSNSKEGSRRSHKKSSKREREIKDNNIDELKKIRKGRLREK